MCMLNDAILVVKELVWNPSWFWLTTRIICAQVWKFESFGACFCTCALIIWSVLLHHSPWIKLAFINDFLLILKGGGSRIRETEPDWLCGLGGRPWGGGGRPTCQPKRPSPSWGCLLESSRLYFFVVWSVSLYVYPTCGPPLVLSW
jgi:hypothetical protein